MLRGKVLHRSKGGHTVTLVKGGFLLWLWDSAAKIWAQEDEMSFESLLRLWLRDIKGGDKFDS